MIFLNVFTTSRTPILIGFLIWLVHIATVLPYSPYGNEQILLLLFAAPLFIVPTCLLLDGYSEKKLWTILLAAIFFTIGFYLEKGPSGVLLVLPWFAIAAYESWSALRNDLQFSFPSIVALAAKIFWLVAAAWAISDRLGYSPLDYDPVIVLLTVVHFHYAGFVLLQLYLLALPYWPKSYGKIIGCLLLAGMPLVAIGISSTQVGLSDLIESLTVTVMASGGIGVALGYFFLAWKQMLDQGKLKLNGIFWMLSGICLLIGMCLAMLYGWRFHHDYNWLSIPWMYAVHGTLNSMGFALFGVLGWLYISPKEIRNPSSK